MVIFGGRVGHASWGFPRLQALRTIRYVLFFYYLTVFFSLFSVGAHLFDNADYVSSRDHFLIMSASERCTEDPTLDHGSSPGLVIAFCLSIPYLPSFLERLNAVNLFCSSFQHPKGRGEVSPRHIDNDTFTLLRTRASDGEIIPPPRAPIMPILHSIIDSNPACRCCRPPRLSRPPEDRVEIHGASAVSENGDDAFPEGLTLRPAEDEEHHHE